MMSQIRSRIEYLIETWNFQCFLCVKIWWQIPGFNKVQWEFDKGLFFWGGVAPCRNICNGLETVDDWFIFYSHLLWFESPLSRSWCCLACCGLDSVSAYYLDVWHYLCSSSCCGDCIHSWEDDSASSSIVVDNSGHAQAYWRCCV